MAGTGLPLAIGTAAVKAWTDMGTEAVRFVRDRLQQALKTQQALLTCTSLEDIWKIQAVFFAAAQKQYATKAGKMLDLIGAATTVGLGATAQGRRSDDVPL